ncbi:hypothetical protein TCAL_04874 [Tigriopus californicus]|uniref:Proline dehydrogenase n=2 Tax=Tigriopus californicus TaxID=6832 RepID=A0A553NZ99_TIGCA|nr:hypothetical protein TCAL_04874 [Tigriopus californicus]
MVLRICSVNVFVDNSLRIMRQASSLMGTRGLSMVLKPTFYGQFVGGDSEEELRHTAHKLTSAGLRLMVCPVQEEDAGEADQLNEEKYDRNLAYIMETGSIMARTGTEIPNLQFKVTAFMPADLVVKLSVLLSRGTYSMEALVSRLSAAMNVGYETDTRKEVNDITSCVTEGQINDLSAQETSQLRRGLIRVKTLGVMARKLGLNLLVDAEYTYMNPGISAVALTMMQEFNTTSAIVSNTYQCYLKDAYESIQKDKSLILTRKGHFGAKIVRGAYMEKERKMAKEQGRPSPVCQSYEDTNTKYDQVIAHMIEYISQDPAGYLVVASHNETSVSRASEMITQKGLKTTGSVVFGQIYGMGEQISMPLANSGHIVYKSVPYGPLLEVLPYLSRRAAENRVVLSGARKERALLSAELRRRMNILD